MCNIVVATSGKKNLCDLYMNSFYELMLAILRAVDSLQAQKSKLLLKVGAPCEH
jgi:hypothetical protein